MNLLSVKHVPETYEADEMKNVLEMMGVSNKPTTKSNNEAENQKTLKLKKNHSKSAKMIKKELPLNFDSDPENIFP